MTKIPVAAFCLRTKCETEAEFSSVHRPASRPVDHIV